MSSSESSTTSTPTTRLTVSSGWQAIKRSPLVVVLVVLGIIGSIYTSAMERQVFPTASIDLKMSRKEILSRAEEMTRRFGYDKQNELSGTQFGGDYKAEVFLERTFGQAEANRLMQHTLPIWFWTCDFKKEFDKETASVQLSPTGELINFTRRLENDRKLPSLTSDEAKAMAIKFVRDEGKISLDQWQLIKSKDETQINRVDHEFEWQEPVEYKGAHRRITVEVSGNVISLFDVSLHTPEDWDHSYKTMRSYNELLASIAFFGFALIALGTAILFVRGIVTKAFSFKIALIWGGLYGLATAANGLNSFPSWVSFYNTSETYSSFILKNICFNLVGAALSVILIGILYAPSQPIYRKLCPTQLPLQSWFKWDVLRSPQVLVGLIVGIAACGIGRGYQIVYYFLGEKFGYWCPLELSEYQALGDAFPFIDALSIGILASTMEEGMFRLMALGMFQRLFRGNFWLANFVQAATWAFGHSSYPQQPPYARGVELTIEGLFDGWLLRRFGLIPCVVSHYLFDAVWVIEPMHSAPASVAWTAYIPVAIPVIALVAGLWGAARKGLIDDTALLKSAETSEQHAEREHKEEHEKHLAEEASSEERPESVFTYKDALSKRWKVILLAIAVISMVATQALEKMGSPIGAHTAPLKATREVAVDKSRQYFADAKVGLNGYEASTELLSPLNADASATYMNENLGFDKTREIIEKIEGPFLWHVRFTKPMSQFEYETYVNQNGDVEGTHVVLPEDATGANLSEADARALAEQYLRKHRPVYEGFEFVDVEKNVRKHRTDYKFTFEVPKYKVADAKLKVYVNVAGDLVSNVTHSWQVPDKWQWAYDRKRPLESELVVVRTSVAFIGFGLLLWFWGELLRGRWMRWKVPLAIGGAVILYRAVFALNNLPGLYINYSPDQPVPSFITEYSIRILSQGLFFALVLVVLSSIAVALVRKEMGRKFIATAFDCAFKAARSADEKRAQRQLWLDAFLVVLAGFSALSAGSAICELLEIRFAHEPTIVNLPAEMVGANNIWFPLGAMGAGAVEYFIYVSCFMIIIPAMLKRFLGGKFWICAPLVLAAVYLFQPRLKYLPDFFLLNAPAVVAIAVFWFIVWPQVRRNPLVVPACGWWLLLLPISTAALHGLPTYTAGLIGLLVIFCLPALYLAYLQLIAKPRALKNQ